MTVIGQAFVAILPDGKGFGPAAEKEIVGGLGPVVKRGAALLGGMFVAKQIFGEFKKGLAELGEQQKVFAQTEAGIASTGGAANLTAKEVSALAGELAALTGIDDELIQSGENLLLTFTRVRNEVGEANDIFTRATKAALDLSVRGFGSMESASITLGKALQDPVKGVTALSRQGITFTAEQKKLIAALVETGDVLGAQKIVLAEVETQVGGSAKAFGETLPGQLARSQIALDDARASLTVAFVPALEAGAAATRFLAGAISDLPAPLQAVVGGVAAGVAVVGGIAEPINESIKLFRALRGAQVAAATVDVAGSAARSAQGLDGLTAATGRTRTGFLTLAGAGRLAAGAAGVGAVILVAHELAEAVDALDAANLTELENALLDLADTGKVTGELAGAFDDDLGRLQQAIERVADPANATKLQNLGAGIVTLGGFIGSTPLEQSAKRIDDIDKALATLAQRDPKSATAALDALKAVLGDEAFGELRPLLNDYDTALSDLDTGARTAAGGLGEINPVLDEQAAALDRAQRAAGRYQQGFDRAFAASTFEASVDRRSQSLNDLRDQLRDAAEAVTDIETSILDARAAGAERQADIARSLADAQRDLARTVEDGAEAVSDAEKALQKASTTGDWTTSAERVADAQEDLDDAIKSRDRSVEDAQRKINELAEDAAKARTDVAKQITGLQRQLAEAQAEASRALEGNTDAALRNREAVRGVVEQAADVITAARDQGRSLEDLKLIRAGEVESLRIRLREMGFEEEAIDRYIAQLDRIPLNKRTVLEVDTAEAEAQLEAFLNKFGSTWHPDFSAAVAAQASGRALGGPVWPGEMFTVGERGMELFAPSQPGTIISNDQLRTALAGAASGRSGGFQIAGNLVLQGAGDPYQSAVEFARQMEALEARSR